MSGRLRVADPADEELWALIQEFVTPDRRYLSLLHGNFLRLDRAARDEFVARLRADAARISDEDLRVLLSSDWRPRLTAAWLVAISRREEFVGEMGALLLESALTYAGQGYTIALASIGGLDCATLLEEYLELWLRRLECRYDQDWVMGALAYLDEVNGTSLVDRFGATGLWGAWAGDRVERETMTELVRDLVAVASDGVVVQRYPCPCCGRLVHDEAAGSLVCPICRWEDDQIQLRWPSWAGGANPVSLIEAQRTFVRLGVSEERHVGRGLRPPSRWPLDEGFRLIDLSVDGFEVTDVQDAAWPDDRTRLYYWRPTFWRAPA